MSNYEISVHDDIGGEFKDVRIRIPIKDILTGDVIAALGALVTMLESQYPLYTESSNPQKVVVHPNHAHHQLNPSLWKDITPDHHEKRVRVKTPSSYPQQASYVGFVQYADRGRLKVLRDEATNHYHDFAWWHEVEFLN